MESLVVFLFICTVTFLVGYLVDSNRRGLAILGTLPILVLGFAALAGLAGVASSDDESRDWGMILLVGGVVVALGLLCCELPGYLLGRLVRRRHAAQAMTAAADVHAPEPSIPARSGELESAGEIARQATAVPW